MNTIKLSNLRKTSTSVSVELNEMELTQFANLIEDFLLHNYSVMCEVKVE